MPIVTFYGRVTPLTGYLITARGDNHIYTLSHFSMNFNFRIVDSLVTIDCDLLDTSEKNINLAYMVVFAHVRGIVDVIAFLNGVGLRLLIEEAQIDGKEKFSVRHGSPVLGPLCSLKDTDIIGIVMTEKRALKPLNDLIETLFNPWDAAMDCYRAIEGICHLLSSDPNKAVRWQTLRENLNISENYLNFIRDRSHSGRHGEAGRVNLSDVDKIQQRSWITMTRFLEFRKRGNVNLSEPEFPPL